MGVLADEPAGETLTADGPPSAQCPTGGMALQPQPRRHDYATIIHATNVGHEPAQGAQSHHVEVTGDDDQGLSSGYAGAAAVIATADEALSEAPAEDVHDVRRMRSAEPAGGSADQRYT